MQKLNDNCHAGCDCPEIDYIKEAMANGEIIPMAEIRKATTTSWEKVIFWALIIISVGYLGTHFVIYLLR